MCTECHDGSASEKLWAYHETLKASLSDIESAISLARDALESAHLEADRSAAVRAQLERLQDDLNFLRVGNGIHNIHYASTLTRALVEQLSSLSHELKIDKPSVTLPEKMELPK
jgi:hypothetical protein